VVENGFDSLLREYDGQRVDYSHSNLALKIEDALERFGPLFLTDVRTIVFGRRIAGHFQTYTREGWLASDLVPPNPRMTLPDYRKNFTGNAVGRKNLDEFSTKVGELVRNGIRVFGFRPPVSPELLALEEQMSGYRELEVAGALEQAGGKWLAIENSGYDTSDGSHLDVRSAILLSGRLAKTIRAELYRQSQPRAN
jgi:hypothetical protein